VEPLSAYAASGRVFGGQGDRPDDSSFDDVQCASDFGEWSWTDGASASSCGRVRRDGPGGAYR